MKRISLLLTLLLTTFVLKAQFNYTLSGNPVVTTGWNMGGSASISGTDIVLTNSTTSSSGYIYYATPVNLTGCSQFTVTFDFKISNSSSSPADGIAFWYITNPPTGFVVGGGIGLPSNPVGLTLLLDTYDNDGNVNNPLGSLRYLNGTNYVEGSATGLIGPDVLYQSFMTNSQWHTCQLVYNNGAMTVAFDGNPPVISGNYSIAINGYFGFSASTGAAWSTHSIKNVSIVGNTLVAPVANSPVSFCQYSQATPLTAVGTSLKWYTTPIGGTGTTVAPTPNTNVPGTYYWYVSQTVPGCGESNRDTVEVVIKPKPTSPNLNYKNTYCAGEPFVPFVASNTLWYTTPTGGSGNPIPPTINTNAPDSVVYYVSQLANGCESDRSTVVVKIVPSPAADFGYTINYGCDGDTVHFNNLTTSGNYYQWDFGDGFGDTALSPTHIYPLQGIYNVKLKAYNNNGCMDSSVQSLNLAHSLVAAFSPDDDTICNNGFVTFINQSTTGPIASYYWDFGDGGVDSNISPIHTFSAPGRYTVRLIVKNFDLVACMDTTYRTIVVDSIPTISFDLSDSTLCEGKGIRFAAQYSEAGNEGIVWDFGDNLGTHLGNPIQHTFDTSGSYIVKLHADYRACPDVDFTKTILIKPFPRLDLGSDTAMCPNSKALVLKNKVPGANGSTKLLWNTGEYASSIIAKHPGIYTAQMNLDGCATDDSVEVFKDCYLDIPNAFTPNADGVNDYFLPRQLLSKGVESFSMTIFNRWGQTLFFTDKINGRGWDGKFNNQSQPQGVYVYQIEVTFKDGNSEKYIGNVTLLP